MTEMQTKNQTYQIIDLSLIDDPERPMRSDMKDEDLEDLAQSIRQNGVIEPIIVRRKGERFEVIAGHRRFAACHLSRTYQVPAVVRDADDRETTVLRVHENMSRKDVNPVDEAIFIARTIKELGWSPEQYAETIKRSPQYVADRLAIAEMSDYMQDALRQKLVPLGVALWLNEIKIEQKKREYLDVAIRDGMSVRQAEQLVRYCESIEHVWIEQNTPESERVLPDVPPVILWPCAKCGQSAPEADLQFVRIHRAECQTLDGISVEGV